MLTRRLVLQGAEGTGWLLFLGASTLIAAACIFLLYRYERRLISRRLGAALLALRLAVVAVVFLVLLEPTIAWTVDRTRTGRIVVAVDVSQSMDTVDQHAGRGEKLRWARALGMIGNDAVDERLDRWIDAYNQGQEPQWVENGETNDPDRRAALAQVRQENVEGVLAEIDRLSRKEIVRRLLLTGPSPLLERLDDLAIVDVSVFAGQVAETDAETLPTALAAPEELRPDLSDLVQPLAAAAVGNEDAPLVGVLLFSDGRDNVHTDSGQAPARLSGLPAPVYPVQIGSRLRPKDLAIGALDFPATVFQDDRPVFKGTLKTSGFDGEQIVVQLVDEDHPEAAPLIKTVRAAGAGAVVEFELNAQEIGRRRMVLRTEPRPGETRSDNNARSFSFQVVDDKADVLVLEGEARWEFRYLEAALARDERVSLETVLFRQPYLGVLPTTFFPRSLELPTDAAPDAETPFAKFDALIVGDVAVDHVSPETWRWIDRYVREEGGTLVLTAGKRHFPLAYRSEVVEELLPVTDLREIRIQAGQAVAPDERGFHLRLTPEGETQDVLGFDADAVENRRIWSTLPGHFWGLAGTAKGGATVWAALDHPDEPGEGLAGERENAMLVHRYVGAGQVLWLGMDSTWRWRFRIGDTYHHRFWGQLVRWAADFKASAGNEFVRFGLDRSSLEAGEAAVVRARWNENYLRRFPSLTARAVVVRTMDGREEEVAAIDLTPAETRPLIFEGRIDSLPAGDYRVRLETENAEPGGDEVTAELTVTERVTAELADLSANGDLLEQIASSTGGRVFLPDQMGEIPNLFQNVTEQTQDRREITLWDHWLVLLLFCGLLMSEWVLRKLNGLP